MSAQAYVTFGNTLSRKRVSLRQHAVAVLHASGVSPNVVGALVPAVRAAFINAVFAFDSVKKAASTQKSPRYHRLTSNRFKFVVNALHLCLMLELACQNDCNGS